MPEIVPTRRTVIRTAAWAVPAVSVAAAAPAFATSPPGEPGATYTTVTRNFTFVSTNALGTFDIPVTVVAQNFPVTADAGVTLLPISTSSTVTIPAAVAPALQFLYLGQAPKIGGTSASTTNFTGALGTFSRTTTLNIAPVAYGGSGALTTEAVGTAQELEIPADAGAGTVTLTLAPPVSTLAGYTNADVPNGSTYDSVLTPKAGEDYTLGTFVIS